MKKVSRNQMKKNDRGKLERGLSMLRRPFVWLLITLIYGFGCLCYDRKYLVGKNFDRYHFSIGWQWILQCWISQKVLGRNRHVPWPVPSCICVGNPQNIVFDPDDMSNFHGTGNYFQGIDGKIIIGTGTLIAPGSGFINANHDPAAIKDDIHLSGKDIILGKCCWIGMGAVVLPGVTLGPGTVVGACSVVTKSFPEGHCVIAGNPAKKIKVLPYDEETPV